MHAVMRRSMMATAALGGAALAACGGTTTEAPVRAGSRPAKLSFLDYTEGAELQMHQEHVAAFRREFPSIEVEHSPVAGGNSVYIEKVLAAAAAGNGGDFLNKEMTDCALTAPPAVEAIEYYVDLAAKHRVAPPSGNDGRNFAFTRGNVAMQIADPRAGTGALKDVVFEWGVVAPPKRKKREVLFTGFAWAVHSQTKYAPEAWGLATFLSRPEFQKDMADRGLALPSLPKLAEQYPIAKSFAATLPVARSLPLHPQLDDMRKEQGAVMTRAGNGEITGRAAAQQMCGAISPLIAKR